MKKLKIPMGLAVGLVLTLLKVHKCEKPTILGKLVFLCFWRFPNNLWIRQCFGNMHRTGSSNGIADKHSRKMRDKQSVLS